MKPGPNPYGVPWELVIGTAIGLFAVLLFLWRSFQSVSCRLYAGRLRKLALKLSGLTEEQCELLEKVRLVQKEHEGLASSLKGGSFEKGSTEAQNLEATYEKLHRSKAKPGGEILSLEKEHKEQKARHAKQDEMMADISQRVKCLEDVFESLKSQIAEAETTFRICQMDEEGLELAIKEALNDNSKLEQSQKPILEQEAEVWKEEASEKITFEDTQGHAEPGLSDEENHIESLIEALLKRKDWSSPSTGAQTDDGNSELGMKSESGTGAHLDDEPEGALKKLVDAAELKASLETLEGERNQMCTSLSEVKKTKEDLLEQMKRLQTERASLESENTQLQGEKQDLQQKFKVLLEGYQENTVKLYRELRVEEQYRVEQEEKLSKIEEKISHTTEQLETYRELAKYLEEQLEKTTRFYQGQIISSEQKAHHSELAARIAERNLSYLMNQNARNRQKLTEKELTFTLLEKDPCALDFSNTALLNGPSPPGQPSFGMRPSDSEKKGPPLPSPLVPVGGGRGSRGPEGPVDRPSSSGRRGSSYNRLTDPQRAPSDPGPLSPPWEQARGMMIPPPGQPYSDPGLPLQRQDVCCCNYGRPSGPAEPSSSNIETESCRHDAKDVPNNSNVPDSSFAGDNQATGSGSVFPPFPPVRGPLFPVDPRSQFMRRGPFFPPPPPPGNMYGAPRGYFPPGPPPPPFPVRNIFSLRCFSHDSPPPPRHRLPHTECQTEFCSGLIPT